jgi:Fe-S-cluster-containing dehydrogenase component
MIHFTTECPGGTTGSFAQICMHCEDPLCARVCEVGAILIAIDGTVLGVNRERCTGCKLCVEACPFGVPLYVERLNAVMKCDMCYDRRLTGERPMCTTACPTGAVAIASIGEMKRTRRGILVHEWTASGQNVRTKTGFISRENDLRFDTTIFDVVDALQGTDGGAYLGTVDGVR